MMTEKLYDKDAYQTGFTAKVISCSLSSGTQAQYDVVLDRTLFFPEEGGQTPDRGTVDEIQVTDVQIRDGMIIHRMAAPLAAGREVHGRIDWQHRFYNMQQHSGEHVFSGIVHQKFGYDNVGFHLSDDIVTMDYNGTLSTEQLLEVERQANQAICENVSIMISWPSEEELAAITYRSKKEIEGQVRIVTIPGYDVCACCAPHVRKTGEIGLLKVVSRQNYKGGVRVSIWCGLRAMQLYDQEHTMMSELAASLSTSADQIPAVFKKQQDEICKLKQKLQKAQAQRMEQQLEEIPPQQKNVFLQVEDVDGRTIRDSVNRLTAAHPGYCGIFSGNEADGYQYVIGSADADAGTAGELLKERFGAKGGGSARMIQGQLHGAAWEDLQEVLSQL
jgi:alanyl-tRNA synthetase